MSHQPPSSHRMGEKKRYYYSNNPNTGIRHGHSGFKKNYGGLINTNLNGGDSTASGSSLNSSTSSFQQSRYDPNSPKRAPSVGRSRYNPDAEAPQSTVAATSVNNAIKKRLPLNHSHSTNISGISAGITPPSGAVGSRYSGSRYNPTQTHTVDSRVLNNNLTQPNVKLGNKASAGHYNNMNRQSRPRSMDLYSKDSGYHYQSTGTSQGSNNAINGVNNTGSYYSRANKWRSISGPPSKLEYDNYNMNGSPAGRSSFWNSQPSVSKYNADVQYSTILPASSASVSTDTPADVKPSSFSKQDENIKDQTDVKTNEGIDSGLFSKSKNLYSLGSSLINSVPQTTRKTEEEHVSIHKEDNNDKNKINVHVEKIEEDDASQVMSEPKQQIRQKQDEAPQGNALIEDNSNIDSGLKSSNGSTLWSTSEPSDKVVQAKIEWKKVESESEKEQSPIFHKISNWCYDDYEFLYDPSFLKTDIAKLNINPSLDGLSEPLKPIETCIFPMAENQMKLWNLKNQSRQAIINKQKYLLKAPIKSLESYPFLKRNILVYKQAVRPLLIKAISKLKKYEYSKKLRSKKKFLEISSNWKQKCAKMDELSNSLREDKRGKKQEINEDLQEQKMVESDSSRERKPSGSSRRRNRADFVDDAEIENVLLQIDPDYKHHQLAAIIPPMIINPVDKFAKKFKDVNNLVTDKQEWATRILKDGIDTFTEHEHELFVEGYLTFPKRFGKISNYMGGLRSPEECVLHYYRTKVSVDYKQLLSDKNKKRQKGAIAKRRKKKERSNELDTNISTSTTDIEDLKELKKVKDAKVQNFVSEGLAPDVEKRIDNQQFQEPSNIEDKDSEDTSINETSNQHQMEQVEIKLVQRDTDKVTREIKETNDTQKTGAQSISESIREPIDDIHPSELAVSADHSVPLKRPYEPNEDADEQKSIQGISSERIEDPMKNITEQDKGMSLTDSIESDAEKTDINGDDNNAQRKKQRQIGEHKSSYWSVKEANLFPELLKTYGSQWSFISEKLGTKSTTMVRNYYQRNAAQLGWKSVVEEADFKRNVTSSGSVQQSQILIQAEQASLSPTYTGIPPQQRPALGFFSNSSSSKERSSSQSINDAALQPFVQDTHKELFSQSSTPTSTLPPPRLPSIQLPSVGSSAINQSSTGLQSTMPERANTTFHDIYPGTAKSPSVPTLLPKLDRSTGIISPSDNLLPKLGENTKTAVPFMPPLKDDDKQLLQQSLCNDKEKNINMTTSTALPSGKGKVVVQELQSSNASSSNSRPAPLSLLLNPENDSPMQTSASCPVSASMIISNNQSNLRNGQSPTISSYETKNLLTINPVSQPAIQRTAPSASSNINFAMDPLGALAAIASETLMPPNHSQRDPYETNTNET